MTLYGQDIWDKRDQRHSALSHLKDRQACNNSPVISLFTASQSGHVCSFIPPTQHLRWHRGVCAKSQAWTQLHQLLQGALLWHP